jgi:hypothetical protein
VPVADVQIPELLLTRNRGAVLRALPAMCRRMLPMLILNGLCPLFLYLVVRSWFGPASPYPLAIAVFFPLLANVLSVIRRRRVDTVGLLVVLSLTASLTVLVIGGDQRTLLITRGLAMPLMGLACLISLALPKPLAFYMIRQFMTGDNPTNGLTFDGLWAYPYVRTASRLASAVWGLAMTAEFGLRVVLVLTLPVVQVLAVSSMLMMAVGLGLGAWNVGYGVRVVRRIRKLTLQPNEGLRSR